MKKNYLLLFLLSVTSVFAQIPTNYYSTATGTGYVLKTQLKKIIDNVNDGLTPEYIHVDRGYGSGTGTTNNGLWSAYGTTDRDNGIGYDNDNTIVDIYTEIPVGADVHNFNFNNESGANEGQCGASGSPNYSVEGDCYNREHIIPQSYFGSTGIMRNDIHHIYPTDGKVNAIHNDYAYGRVDSPTATYTSTNGSKLGQALNSGYSAGFSGIVFEPIDEFKGDIARVYLYFATRYEDQMPTFYSTYTSVDCRVMFDGSADKVFNSTFLNILLNWNAIDPVSTKEIVRNNASYVHQGNRNPYIDHPEYVCRVWGAAACALGNDEFTLTDKFYIYPNPSNGNFSIEYDTTIGNIDVEIYSTLGQKVFEKQNIDNHIITTNGLQSGVYLLKITNESRSTFKKIIIN